MAKHIELTSRETVRVYDENDATRYIEINCDPTGTVRLRSSDMPLYVIPETSNTICVDHLRRETET